MLNKKFLSVILVITSLSCALPLFAETTDLPTTSTVATKNNQKEEVYAKLQAAVNISVILSMQSGM